MNHAGEIAVLAEICRPTIRLITNIGPVHLEGVSTLIVALFASLVRDEGLSVPASKMVSLHQAWLLWVWASRTSERSRVRGMFLFRRAFKDTFVSRRLDD
jgi:hypothetical protein